MYLCNVGYVQLTAFTKSFFKVNNGNTRTVSGICSKSIIKNQNNVNEFKQVTSGFAMRNKINF